MKVDKKKEKEKDTAPKDAGCKVITKLVGAGKVRELDSLDVCHHETV